MIGCGLDRVEPSIEVLLRSREQDGLGAFEAENPHRPVCSLTTSGASRPRFDKHYRISRGEWQFFDNQCLSPVGFGSIRNVTRLPARTAAGCESVSNRIELSFRHGNALQLCWTGGRTHMPPDIGLRRDDCKQERENKKQR